MQIMPIEERVSNSLAGYAINILMAVETELPESRSSFAPFIISGAVCAWAEVMFKQNRYLSGCYLDSIFDDDLFGEVEKDISDRAHLLAEKTLDSMRDVMLVYRIRDNPFVVFLDELHRLLHLVPQKERDIQIMKILKEQSEEYLHEFTLEQVSTAAPPPPLSPAWKEFLRQKRESNE